ncbi:carbohydrate ABC transporter permease [Alkalihalobacillus oceani]|uniref:Carbohydrate ABC transporter permease n=1 Tax=Halalkalibacter oceani TaxID=1653776 RepID=A0A9X2DQ02_9BACI|nr:carbohydrate ABC transporter permease [Halalkalibacter oceani]MCM3712978.1 carbohydrate ABC transporter permease [Halalkalibacter oceani]
MNNHALASKKNVLKLLSIIGISACALITLVPLVWMLATSLKIESEAITFPPTLIGSRLAFENFADAWNFIPFGRYFFNTIFVSVSIVILELLTASLAAYAFARLRFPGRDLLFVLYLSTLMIPVQVTIIPQFILMNYFGWIDTYQGLILPNAFTAFGTFLLRQFFLGIPYELEEAGRIDGCTRFGLYWRIILPLGKPALAALAVFSFVNQWNNFLWPLIMTNSVEMRVLSVGLQAFQLQYGTVWHLMMAAAAIAIIPSILVFVFLQRYLEEGITMSGMGGR